MNILVITLIIIGATILCVHTIAEMYEWICDLIKGRDRTLSKTKKESEFVDKPWGKEEIWAKSTYGYVGKILTINQGQRLSRQYHEKKVETIRILKGTMNLHLEYKKERHLLTMYPGDVYHIDRGVIHRMEAIIDTEVLEVSTSELDDVVRLEDDYGR